MNLLVLPNENCVDPDEIHGVSKIARKGVVLRAGGTNMLDFIAEVDPARQSVIVTVLMTVLKAGAAWEQPDWAQEFAKAKSIVK